MNDNKIKLMTRNVTESCEKENSSSAMANFHDDGRIEIERQMKAKKEKDMMEEKEKNRRERLAIATFVIQAISTLILAGTLFVAILNRRTVLEQPIKVEFLPTLPMSTQSGNEKSDAIKSDPDTNQ